MWAPEGSFSRAWSAGDDPARPDTLEHNKPPVIAQLSRYPAYLEEARSWGFHGLR
jgi:hypothetical protein